MNITGYKKKLQFIKGSLEEELSKNREDQNNRKIEKLMEAKRDCSKRIKSMQSKPVRVIFGQGRRK